MKRSERIALSLRMREGIAASELKHFGRESGGAYFARIASKIEW